MAKPKLTPTQRRVLEAENERLREELAMYKHGRQQALSCASWLLGMVQTLAEPAQYNWSLEEMHALLDATEYLANQQEAGRAVLAEGGEIAP